jgi:hypothetical protein
MQTTTYAEHGTPDYNSKTALGCEAAGEPVFLLRAQDRWAAETVRYWASLALDPDLKELAFQIAAAMEAWPRVKEPD